MKPSTEKISHLLADAVAQAIEKVRSEYGPLYQEILKLPQAQIRLIMAKEPGYNEIDAAHDIFELCNVFEVDPGSNPQTSVFLVLMAAAGELMLEQGKAARN
jgi:hypothetical protein